MSSVRIQLIVFSFYIYVHKFLLKFKSDRVEVCLLSKHLTNRVFFNLYSFLKENLAGASFVDILVLCSTSINRSSLYRFMTILGGGGGSFGGIKLIFKIILFFHNILINHLSHF